MNFDVAIIGGGLAGLSSAIEMVRKGHTVILFEKKAYPFHKVCGEYISNESWEYLKYLGIKLEEMNLPKIDRLTISTEKGALLNQPLTKGGFGTSRYFLDSKLAQVATKEGVILEENTEVTAVNFENSQHLIRTKTNTYKAKVVIGSFGKRSALDKTLKRKFIDKILGPKSNYVAVKYHVEANLPANLIGLHFFKDGYCGISKIEGKNKFCLCYLTLASNLKISGTIQKMEEEILSRNENLKKYFQFKKLYKNPEVISQVNFSKKEVINNHIIMVGDSSSLIVPLFGNGMSMALSAANNLQEKVHQFLIDNISRAELEFSYKKWWKKEFGFRLAFGRKLQQLLYVEVLANPTLKFLNKRPTLAAKIIKMTHGKDIKKAAIVK